MSLKKTIHACNRQKQRGIAPVMIDVLLLFGDEEPAANGCSRLVLKKRGVREAKAYLGRLAKTLAKKDWSAYMVVSPENHVVTVGYIH